MNLKHPEEPLDSNIAMALETFDETVAMLEEIESEHRLQAQHAFDEFQKSAAVEFSESLKSSIPAIASTIRSQRVHRFASVVQMLNADSLPYFLEIIASEHLKEARAEQSQRRHADTNRMKIETFHWLCENFAACKSADAAAEAIEKLHPVEFRTAQLWIREWRKPLSKQP